MACRGHELTFYRACWSSLWRNSEIVVLKSDAVSFWVMQLVTFNKVSHGCINASKMQAILLSGWCSCIGPYVAYFQALSYALEPDTQEISRIFGEWYDTCLKYPGKIVLFM